MCSPLRFPPSAWFAFNLVHVLNDPRGSLARSYRLIHSRRTQAKKEKEYKEEETLTLLYAPH